MCDLAGVNRAGYYRQWQERHPLQEETRVRDRIQSLALKHRHYGHRRIAVLLRREGVCINLKRALRIMREDNLLCLRKKSFVPATTQSNHKLPVWPNLARRMMPTAVNQLWVADITYVRLDEAFVYLAIILDAFSRMVIGWALQPHLKAELALEALRNALAKREITPGLIHHSDRGIQYACADYIAELTCHGIQPSQSKQGCPYDNAMAESFMKTLKHEEIDASCYRDIEHLRQAMTDFIDNIYNKERLHSALGYRSPQEYEIIAASQPWAKTQTQRDPINPKSP